MKKRKPMRDNLRWRRQVEIDCVRFPDQCPCTTELGKGIA